MAINFQSSDRDTVALNFSSARGAMMLGLMGVDARKIWDTEIELREDALSDAIERLIRAVNSKKALKCNERPTVTDGRFIDVGFDEEYIYRRGREVITFLGIARASGASVYFT